jgi:hypothetical protein
VQSTVILETIYSDLLISFSFFLIRFYQQSLQHDLCEVCIYDLLHNYIT